MSSSPYIDNKKKDILILGKGPTQGLESTLTAEKKCILLILQRFGKCDFVECNSTEHINGRNKTNKY